MTPTTRALRDFLEHPSRPADTLSYHETQGFLFTVAAAPELVQPSEWLPIIFAEHDPGYSSLEEANQILGELMEVYNDINRGVLEEHPSLPSDCTVYPNVLDNLEPSAPLSRWCRGFLIGYEWLEELWDVEMPDDMDEEVGAMLMTLSFFASRKLAESFHREVANESGSLETFASELLTLLPDAIGEYAHIGRTVLAGAYAEAARQEPRTVTKVGRNDPCPCQSGKKFKKCCGADVQ